MEKILSRELSNRVYFESLLKQFNYKYKLSLTLSKEFSDGDNQSGDAAVLFQNEAVAYVVYRLRIGLTLKQNLRERSSYDMHILVSPDKLNLYTQDKSFECELDLVSFEKPFLNYLISRLEKQITIAKEQILQSIKDFTKIYDVRIKKAQLFDIM